MWWKSKKAQSGVSGEPADKKSFIQVTYARSF